MKSIEAGYAGGTFPSPEYRQMEDHTECIRVVYETKEISDVEIVEEFWRLHSGRQHGYGGTQYQSVLLYLDEEQKEAAFSVKQNLEQGGRDIETRIESAGSFHRAEEYHQKYQLKRFPHAWSAVEQYFESSPSAAASEMAMRLNALAAGELSKAEVLAFLSAPEQEIVRQIKW
ncbi:hypothetical protein C6I21_12945 [Alkalicoccus urumqiensis]|uniref:peptide-methionine (S)-S-oxide reductase n=1 Tax=Alkalicoccus urumqiensis TaxID=1548213 RepID=A0A2P6MEY8_ALKUR|nr:hypothetical protein C6I21_12945 [Alkalicoccus urumqiensis]